MLHSVLAQLIGQTTSGSQLWCNFCVISKDQFRSLLPMTEPEISLTLALHGRKRCCGYEKQCRISPWLSWERAHFKVCAEVLSLNPVWCVHTSSAVAVLDRFLWTERAWKWQLTSWLPDCQGHGSVIKGMLYWIAWQLSLAHWWTSAGV